VAAGTINTIVGSGTLITFPTLLALGYPPVTANVSNNIGLCRRHQRHLGLPRGAPRPAGEPAPAGPDVAAGRGDRCAASALAAGVRVRDRGAGADRRLAGPGAGATPARRGGRGAARAGRDGAPRRGPGGDRGTYVAGVYGGYFGAAQGVLLVGLLGSLLAESLQRINALKNVLALVVNAVSAVTFLVVRPEAVDAAVVGLIAVGSLAGGVLGATVGRRLSPRVLRAVIVVVGTVAIVRLVLT
jgi:uncharacterized membrane protein YfcA